MNRKVLAVGAALAMGLGMTACSSGGGSTAPASGGDQSGGAAASGDGSYRVAYIARAQVDSFAAWLANEMKAEAANYPDMTLDVYDGQANDETVNTMIENAVANKYDAIIIQPNNGEAQRPYIENAVASGAVVIATNPRVDGIAGLNTVDASPYDQGKVVAELAVDAIPENAKVVVLTGPAGNFHSTERRKAWQAEFFDKRPDVTIVAEDIANWNKDEAMTLMEDWSMAYGPVNAIISMNDNMAAGALEAIRGDSGYDDLLVYGVDGTPEATLLIQDGLMTATTLQNAKELAQLNIKAAHDLLTGAIDEVNVDIGNPVITKDNAAEYVKLYKEAGLIK